MSPTLHTARLVLTPVGDHDLAPLHAHWNDPQVARWLWDASPVPLQTVADVIAHSNGMFRTAARGLWAIRPATAAPLVGACGLSAFEPCPGIELLYSLAAPTHWSKGLATEAATAVLAYAFDVLTLPEVLATTDDANKASIHLLTRLGATPTPRVQIGPHTYPSFRIRPHTDPGLLLPGPCSSMDRATDFSLFPARPASPVTVRLCRSTARCSCAGVAAERRGSERLASGGWGTAGERAMSGRAEWNSTAATPNGSRP